MQCTFSILGNLLHHGSSIDGEDFSVHVGSQVAGEEEKGVGNILRLAQPFQWNAFCNAFSQLFWQGFEHVGFDDARRYGIDADVIFAEFLARDFVRPLTANFDVGYPAPAACP